MRTIGLTIKGVDWVPEWAAMERYIAAMVGDGRLVRIARDDGGADYRGLGEYRVGFVAEDGEEFEVMVKVEG